MNSIEISNFKNFRHLQIDNLGCVNLIVGKNNSGKSTLLEAISILASGGNVGWLKKILEIRGWNCAFTDTVDGDNESLELVTLCSLSHGRNFEIFKKQPIKIKSKCKEDGTDIDCQIEIRLVELASVVETDESGLEFRKYVLKERLNNTKGIGDGEPTLGVSISSNDNKLIFTLSNFFSKRGFSTDKNIPFEYVRTAEFSGAKNPILFDKIALSPLEGVLIESLKIIDPHITAINFLNDESRSSIGQKRGSDTRVPFVVCDNIEGKYRLSAMGDGINRILTIVLSMLNCKDGILLVDEFENGLHYSVQTSLWSLILRLAKELNIQVFATTHSQDCIRSFLRATKSDSDKARLIRLEQRADKDVAVVYDDSDEFEYISQNDIETR